MSYNFDSLLESAAVSASTQANNLAIEAVDIPAPYPYSVLKAIGTTSLLSPAGNSLISSVWASFSHEQATFEYNYALVKLTRDASGMSATVKYSADYLAGDAPSPSGYLALTTDEIEIEPSHAARIVTGAIDLLARTSD